MQYLTFGLNGVEYAVEVGVVETVVEFTGYTSVPTPSPYVLGVMDLRGVNVPLIDLRKKFGLPEVDGIQAASVVVFTFRGQDPEPTRIAARVDSVSEVVTLDEGSVEARGHHGEAFWEHFVSGIARLGSRAIVVISPESLMTRDELGSMQAGQEPAGLMAAVAQ
jgi:purine-binding chemotaxis protein CheW